jgi:hypothetical protein
MKKYFFYIFIGLFVFKNLFANNVDIQENIDLKFYCELEKKIIKDSEYNYQVFLANDLDIINLEKFEIKAKKPEIFSVQGLSSFFTNTLKFKVTVVNKDVVLFKAIDEKRKYSESAIIDRNSGELIHEITRNIKSENSEKDISFYSCSKKEKKV